MNLANSFLKDITSNNSPLNSLGSKIKNISQSIPDTKELISSATSTLSNVNNNLTNSSSNANSGATKSSSSGFFEQLFDLPSTSSNSNTSSNTNLTNKSQANINTNKNARVSNASTSGIGISGTSSGIHPTTSTTSSISSANKSQQEQPPEFEKTPSAGSSSITQQQVRPVRKQPPPPNQQSQPQPQPQSQPQPLPQPQSQSQQSSTNQSKPKLNERQASIRIQPQPPTSAQQPAASSSKMQQPQPPATKIQQPQPPNQITQSNKNDSNNNAISGTGNISSSNSNKKLPPPPTASKQPQRQYDDEDDSSGQIDPMQYTAVMETNQALKSELQRLSVIELKYKQLEKDAKSSKSLKDTNEKLESQIEELLVYKTKAETIENELKKLNINKRQEEENIRRNEEHFNEIIKNLEHENRTLKERLNELERMVQELEASNSALKESEKALETRNRSLEDELKHINDRINSTDMNHEKLTALEEANHILEKELEDLKEHHKVERLKLKEKMDLLINKNNAKIKKLEEENRELVSKADNIDENRSLIESYKKHIEELTNRITELELFEKSNGELQRTINQLNQEIKNQKQACNDEKKNLESERKNLTHLNEDFAKINSAMIELSNKHDNKIHEFETKIKTLMQSIEKKESELEQLKQAKEADSQNFLAKLSLLNDENMELANQLKNVNQQINSKEEELNKLKKMVNDSKQDREKMQAQLNSYQNLENELVDTHLKNSQANEKIHELEVKLEEMKKHHEIELNKFHNINQQSELQLKELNQKLKTEMLKSENLNHDNSLFKLELNKMEQYKQKCENLEKRLFELQSENIKRANEAQLVEKYESEIKYLTTQIINLQNNLKLKNEEVKQMEKLVEANQQKTSTLSNQLDEVNMINSQLALQNTDAKRRIMSIDLLTDECNQLRKNLTLTTIESESRKAEVASLNSQIAHLEGTVKSLRESMEKSNHIETNYESTAYELKKKQEDLRKLQQLHESTKKEQLDTIELLEDKLRDIEKKTELQALKHEEILLELESIRARRERLLPICPNCSSQTLNMYQPVNQTSTSTGMTTSQYQDSSQSPNYLYHQSHKQQYSKYQDTISSNQCSPKLNQLSVTVPSNSINPSQYQSPANLSSNNQMNGGILSPNQFQQLLQVITTQNHPKQYITTDCQTSPTNETSQQMFNFSKFSEQLTISPNIISRQQSPKLNINSQNNSLIQIVKSNASSQTDLKEKPHENKEVNTDPIRHPSMVSASTNTLPPPPPPAPLPPPPPPPQPAPKKTRNQAINVNLYEETVVKNEKHFEEKSCQSSVEQTTPLPAFLYKTKYSYDPFKNSPNDNPAAELPLEVGEYLFIINEEDEDGFFMGELLTGRRGLVPSNFVEKVTINESNLNKLLPTLPKNLLTNKKFSEWLNYYKLDAGQLIIAAQQASVKTISTVSTATITTSDLLPPVTLPPTKPTVNPNDITKQYLTDNTQGPKFGVPYPNNLRLEKKSDRSILVNWDPPTAPLGQTQSIDYDNNFVDVKEQVVNVQTYNLFLNNDIYKSINGNQPLSILIQDIDLNATNRVSIQAIGLHGTMSKPQECTLLLGSSRSLAPSLVTAQNLTQTSAIITWWPSSSTFTHILTIDSIEHKTLRPGIFRYKLSNLQPNSSHLITVTAQIQSVNESLPASTTSQFKPSIHSSSIEFRTLPTRQLEIPQNVKLERDRRDHDNYILSWQPTILSSNDTTSNGIQVGGYSIYLDGVKIHQILNPLASSVSLSPKLIMGNGANSLLTIRTLSLDGSLESKDSEPFKLSNILEDNIQASVTKRVQINQNIPEPVNPNKNRIPTNDSPTISVTNDSTRRVIPHDAAAKQSPPTIQPDKIANLNVRSDSVTPPQVLTPINKKPPVPGAPIINIPKVSDARKPKNDPKFTANTDLDLYENNKANSTSSQKQSRSSKPSSSRTSPSTVNPSKLNASSSSNVMSKKSTKESLRDPSSSNLSKPASSKINENYRVFIALFDYDPFKMSPNTDSCQEELPFKEGQLIKIYGEQDADGFFYGESNGKYGYIPCNMVSEVQVDDPEVVKHLLNENPQSAPAQKSRSSGAATSSSKTSGVSKQHSTSSKNQSFVPVANANKSSKNEKKCVMVALYDYDPQYSSPNADVDVELPFKTGDIITVFGEMDEDGFFMAELNGKRGLVPSNFLQPVHK